MSFLRTGSVAPEDPRLRGLRRGDRVMAPLPIQYNAHFDLPQRTWTSTCATRTRPSSKSCGTGTAEAVVTSADRLELAPAAAFVRPAMPDLPLRRVRVAV